MCRCADALIHDEIDENRSKTPATNTHQSKWKCSAHRKTNAKSNKSYIKFKRCATQLFILCRFVCALVKCKCFGGKYVCDKWTWWNWKQDNFQRAHCDVAQLKLKNHYLCFGTAHVDKYCELPNRNYRRTRTSWVRAYARHNIIWKCKESWTECRYLRHNALTKAFQIVMPSISGGGRPMLIWIAHHEKRIKYCQRRLIACVFHVHFEVESKRVLSLLAVWFTGACLSQSSTNIRIASD